LVLRISAIAGLTALALHVAHGQFGLGGHALNAFADNWLYDAIIMGAAVSCLARARLVHRQQLAWLVLGVGLAFDACGEIYYTFAFGDSGTPPVPSLADFFYLLFYPAAYVALVLLVRERLERFRASTWLDGAIAAATSAAVIAAIAFDPIVRGATHGSPAAVATNLAYPVGDLILLAIVFGMFALTGWNPGRAWLLLGLGLGLSAVADTAYLYANADGTYTVGGILDSFWLASALATSFAAWQPAVTSKTVRLEGLRLLLIPGVLALMALAAVLYGGFHHENAIGLALAGAALLLGIGRAAWSLHENIRLLDNSRREAVTDALTGLGNRRGMNAELERVLADGAAAPPAVLVAFDLDGFKVYNDRFGHLAGDALLVHLADRLQRAVAGIGSAYRQGGDEFCVLLRCDPAHGDGHVTAALAALSAEGETFSVRASHGQVSIPLEAYTVASAVRLADDRMYSRKGDRRGSARQRAHDVLLGLRRERQPDLHDHLPYVGQLAVSVGRKLAMNEEQLDEVRRSAELHDIGKAAIPDAILNKPGPLQEDEGTFMRRHPLIGERILTTAPALAPVAILVRSSHERWDGNGYPDGLVGETIPLGARIVSVCDAFDAMTSERPYAASMSPARALAELRQEAGKQFDPQIVEAFELAWQDMYADKPAHADATPVAA
jgi:diguanylate cyclase (GGDEF)-like protein